jgi:Tol biopolymer transport system component
LVRIDLATGNTFDLLPVFPHELREPVIDPKGGLCWASGGVVACVDPDAKAISELATAKQPLFPGTRETSPFSPSGDRLVFASVDARGNRNLWFLDRITGTKRMLCSDLGPYRVVTFLGEDHVLLSDPNDKPQPLIRVAVASGKQEVVSPEDAEWTEPVVSPDGTLMLGREREGTRDLWLMYRPTRR